MTDRSAATAIDPAARNDEVVVETRNAAGILTLSRPETHNALNARMRARLTAAFAAFARDPIVYAVIVRSACPGVFSAGLDVDELVGVGGLGRDAVRATIGEAIRLCWLHESFTKPTVALIDGSVAGSGFGIGLHGTHRVAGERYVLACPEVAAGLVPSGGMCHMLAHLPHSIGTFLALTGEPLGRADAFHLSLVTHCVPSSDFDIVVQRLADADPVDAILEELHHDPGARGLAPVEDLIARCFSASSIDDILERLETERGAHTTWALQMAGRLRRQPPLALKATLRLLAEARVGDLRTLLMLEHRVLCGLMGMSAAPHPANSAQLDPSGSLAQATPAMVSALFSDAAGPLLALPPRPRTLAWDPDAPPHNRSSR